MSLLFSPIKKLIVKAFVSNLQLTNRQLCTKGKSATQSNTPEGFSISTACNYNTCNCPEYSRAVNAIKRWVLLGNRCGFAHLCSPSLAQYPWKAVQQRGAQGHPAGQGRSPGTGATRAGAARRPLRAAPPNAARASEFPPSLLQHMHRGCRTGGQTMRITQFTFEPKINDFKLQSEVKHAPSSILRHVSQPRA